ncbi:unnamed protein product [Ostreobium quekettii]|uniref:Dynein heavy chain linker domain-containing protein n=1 Tax=Ostreobium quekettii TaxID=121088 RepID=A0A8S1ISQ0_9CHLO|nr:unnamed protein product [Ostreobium quekettii]
MRQSSLGLAGIKGQHLSGRVGAVEESQEVMEFVKAGRDILEFQAANVKEIGEARQRSRDLVHGLPRMLELRRRIEEKNKLVKQVAMSGNYGYGGLVDMRDISNEWDTFTAQLQQHGETLEERQDQLRRQILKQIDEFKERLEGFSYRWRELMPKSTHRGDPKLILVRIEEVAQTLAEFKEEASQYEADCQHFSMDPPDFSTLENVSNGIESAKEAWSRYGSFLEERDELASQDWLSLRDKMWKIDDFLMKWSRQMENSMDDPVSLIVMREVDKYGRCLPYLKHVKGNGWDRKHWLLLFGMLGIQTSGPSAVCLENLTLSIFLNKADALIQKSERIQELDSQAQGEAVLHKALDELNTWGYQRKFSLMKHSTEKKERNLVLIKEWKDLVTEVGDHQSLVSSLRASPYFSVLKVEPLVARFADLARMRDNLPQLSSQLDICQRALSDFLEEKRSAFARLYFIGDGDLLEILGQPKNPAIIQSHLKKIFAGIHNVQFEKGGSQIEAILSADGERVELIRPVLLDSNVENWLGELLRAVHATLATSLATEMESSDFKANPSQVLCLAEGIRFSEGMEKAIRSGTVAQFSKQLRSQLEEYTASDWTGYRIMQLKVQSLVLDLIHYLEVADALTQEGTSDLEDWAWAKQLKYRRQVI